MASLSLLPAWTSLPLMTISKASWTGPCSLVFYRFAQRPLPNGGDDFRLLWFIQPESEWDPGPHGLRDMELGGWACRSFVGYDDTDTSNPCGICLTAGEHQWTAERPVPLDAGPEL
jgi:hypothetical protein